MQKRASDEFARLAFTGSTSCRPAWSSSPSGAGNRGRTRHPPRSTATAGSPGDRNTRSSALHPRTAAPRAPRAPVPVRFPCWDERGGHAGTTPGDRHLPAAPGPDVRLLPRREEPLRGRPGGGGQDASALAGRPHRGAGEPGVPRPGGQVPGGRGGHPAVPRHRDRAADHEQRARGGAGVAPASRVVYADNDPLVLAHARALLTSAPEGRTAYIHADLRDPQAILATRSPATCSTSASRSR